MSAKMTVRVLYRYPSSYSLSPGDPRESVLENASFKEQEELFEEVNNLLRLYDHHGIIGAVVTVAIDTTVCSFFMDMPPDVHERRKRCDDACNRLRETFDAMDARFMEWRHREPVRRPN